MFSYKLKKCSKKQLVLKASKTTMDNKKTENFKTVEITTILIYECQYIVGFFHPC